MGHDEGVKKNLKILIPVFILVVIAQILLVRTFIGKANQDVATVIGTVDTSIPHPSDSYDAKQVVQVVVYALRHNDLPQKDAGLRALWQFMTPRLKELLRDKALVRSFLGEELWSALVDFDDYSITREKITEDEASFEVIFQSKKRLERRLVISLKKTAELWLIDMLAQKS